MTWYRKCQCPTTREKLVLSGEAIFGTPTCLNCNTPFSKVCNNAKANAFNNADKEELPHINRDDIGAGHEEGGPVYNAIHGIEDEE